MSNQKYCIWQFRVCAIICFSIFLNYDIQSAPVWGDTITLHQPDGERVKARVWGDEFYRRVESLDGYTLTKNHDGWICYAHYSEDRSHFIPSPHRYRKKGFHHGLSIRLSNEGIVPGMKINEQAKQQIVKRRMEDLFGEGGIDGYLAEASEIERDEIFGLTVLIEFPDDPATVTPEEIEDFLNKPGYNKNGNNGSVYDYFYEVSSKKLSYKNMVTRYYTAKNNKAYYDNPEDGKPKELLTEALNGLKDSYDFSTLSTNTKKRVLAVNVLYAGKCNSPWAKGLWPHSGGLSPKFTDDGVTISRYQMTSLGSRLSIGTTIHENGHMICGFPDLYDYGKDSKGVGGFCFMCRSGGRNPIIPNAYFRALKKWETPVDITDAPTGTLFKHLANSYSSFVYKNKNNSNEMFYIESRRKLGRNKQIPDTGLVIWHIDKKGSNNNQEMTPSKHYHVSVEQADGLCEMEKNENSGKDNDLFHSGHKTEFNDKTKPSAHWWDGNSSGLHIGNISAVGKEMSFTMGSITKKSVQKNNTVFANRLSISANPASRNKDLTFSFIPPTTGYVTFQICTMQGKTVYDRTLHPMLSHPHQYRHINWDMSGSHGEKCSVGNYYVLLKHFSGFNRGTTFWCSPLTIIE